MTTDWRWAADGGGSRCRMVLDTGAARHAATLGPANIASDFDSAIEVLGEGLGQLADAAGVSVEALLAMPACLALAGVLEAQDETRVTQALGLTHARVTDDRLAAVLGALHNGDGAVAGLGTGSFFATRMGGAVRFAGGWGARLGDEASGFWLGREALRVTLETVDGLRPTSDLTADILARFAGRASALVAFAAASTPDAYAALAPRVFDAATAGDAAGRDSMTRGAAHVAKSLARLGHTDGAPLCLVGGLAKAYAGWLPPGLAAGLAPPRMTALEAALVMAAEGAR